MHAVLSGLRPSTATFPIRLTSNPVCPNPKAYCTCQSLQIYFSSRRDGFHLFLPGIRCEGTRRGRPRKSGGSRRSTTVGNGFDLGASDDKASKSPNQEEIIALFKKIQTSISKDSTGNKRRITKRTKDTKSSESVLEDLQHYRPTNHAKGKGDILPIKNAEPEREEQNSNDADRLPRPVSKFVKRSPIRSMALASNKTSREEVSETEESVNIVKEEIDAITSEPLELKEINTLKLPELKELAKLKGVKGFSKLKKGELVELLKGMTQ